MTKALPCPSVAGIHTCARFHDCDIAPSSFAVPVSKHLVSGQVHGIDHHVQPMAEQMAVLGEGHRADLWPSICCTTLMSAIDAIARLACGSRSRAVGEAGSAV
jgi:hypothetical protein